MSGTLSLLSYYPDLSHLRQMTDSKSLTDSSHTHTHPLWLMVHSIHFFGLWSLSCTSPFSLALSAFSPSYLCLSFVFVLPTPGRIVVFLCQKARSMLNLNRSICFMVYMLLFYGLFVVYMLPAYERTHARIRAFLRTHARILRLVWAHALLFVIISLFHAL